MLDLQVRGVSVMPSVLAALAFFGFGGLFAVRVLGSEGDVALLLAIVCGLIGAAVAWLLFGTRGRLAPDPPSLDALVGTEARVIVGIPAGRTGRVEVASAEDTREYTATAATDLAPGSVVRVTGSDAEILVVEAPDPPP